MAQNEPVSASVRVLSVTPEYLRAFWIAARNCYFRGTFNELQGMFTEESGRTLLQKIIQLKHDSCLEHISFQISLEGVSRSFMAQITRHRHVTFHISSQHFQNHSDFCYVIPDFVNPNNKELFINTMNYLNEIYKTIIGNGDKHYIAREVLPNAAACKIIMTVNLREIRHIIRVRQGMENTPEMIKVIKMIKTALELRDPLFVYML